VVMTLLLSRVLRIGGLNVLVTLELITTWIGAGVKSWSVSRLGLIGFKVWSLGVMSMILAHVYLPLLTTATLPFLLIYWMLLGTWLMLVPMVGMGSMSVRLLTWLATLSLRKSAWVLDLGIVTMLVRGVYGLGNYLFQMSYFSFRLWLVFVLHAFCLGAFMELLGSLESMLPMDFCLGLLCLSMMLGAMLVGYLGIQLYVYLSFSASFLSGGVLAWWNGLSLVAVSLTELGNLNGSFLGLAVLLFFTSLSSVVVLPSIPGFARASLFLSSRLRRGVSSVSLSGPVFRVLPNGRSGRLPASGTKEPELVRNGKGGKKARGRWKD